MKPHLPILILLAISLLIGMLTFNDYGESWDVNSLRHYADSSLSLYGGLFGGAAVSPDSIQAELALGNYGPAFMMLVNLAERAAGSPDGGPASVQSMVYFITFLIGLISMYFLCLRWVSGRAAFGAALLFLSQPVLWGHAFINPKDIPFMSFFLLTILLGFRLTDRLQPLAPDKAILITTVVFWLAPFLIAFFASGLILPWLESLVRSAAAGGSNIISLLASDITTAPVEVYIQKVSSLYIQISFFYLLLSTVVLFVWVYRFARPTFNALLPAVLAGAVLGFTAAIRNIGLFGGLIVLAYLLWKHRRRAWPHALVYLVTGAIFIYFLWPYLWPDPAGRLVESLAVMSKYPWTGSVLFNGISYPAMELPSYYLPLLLGIKLTELLWPLCLAGLIIAMLAWRQKSELLLLTLAWSILPLAGMIIFKTVLYDNFRQLLFILPPVFLMAGLAFDQIKRPLLQAGLIGLSVLPGLLGVIPLHPYEYIYYNRFIGGVNGAAGKFETDYWGTSFREAADYLNEVAPANSNIWVEGPTQSYSIFARTDLHIYSTHEVERAEHYDYVVATTRYGLDRETYPEAEIIHLIRRGRAVLAVIKKP